ncbi:MAG: copper oxidase [Nocardioides sp.]|nr:copper oxidase [Nocardioides sp.]
MTRRGVLGAGLAVAAAAGLGAWRWRPWSDGGSGATTGGTWSRPDVRRSAAGVLDTRLTARAGVHELAGARVQSLAFEGGHPGPTLRVAPGDTLKIELVNELDEPTNLHVHGLQVSPGAPGDDVFTLVQPGASRTYEYDLPTDHPTGVFWYHPHAHERVADQLWAGLCGAIVVCQDPAADESSTGERVLVVTDVTLAGDAVAAVSQRDRMNGREGDLVLVDGQSEPVLEGAPGATETWYVVNACCSRYLSLRTDGDLAARCVARDQGGLDAPLALEDLVVPPGGRAVLEVDVGDGSVRLVPVDRGGMGGMGGTGGMMGGSGGGTDGSVRLLSVVTADAVPAPSTRVDAPAALGDLRDRPVAVRRTLTLASGMGGGMGGGMRFTVDGAMFDPDRTDQAVILGDVEEWTVRNTSSMAHPFHLHVWPMQVLVDGAGDVTEPRWLDVVDVPAYGEVVVRVSFDRFPGRSVYHCHVLDHEDLGMMGVVEVG